VQLFLLFFSRTPVRTNSSFLSWFNHQRSFPAYPPPVTKNQRFCFRALYPKICSGFSSPGWCDPQPCTTVPEAPVLSPLRGFTRPLLKTLKRKVSFREPKRFPRETPNPSGSEHHNRKSYLYISRPHLRDDEAFFFDSRTARLPFMICRVCIISMRRRTVLPLVPPVFYMRRPSPTQRGERGEGTIFRTSPFEVFLPRDPTQSRPSGDATFFSPIKLPTLVATHSAHVSSTYYAPVYASFSSSPTSQLYSFFFALF